MKLEVGMYVRTKNGLIAKYIGSKKTKMILILVNIILMEKYIGIMNIITIMFMKKILKSGLKKE